MHKLDQGKVGLALGSLVAIVHLVWSLLVWGGVAKQMVGTALSLHFLSVPVSVLDFSASTAAYLIIATFVGGYLVGFVFASLWNWFEK